MSTTNTNTNGIDETTFGFTQPSRPRAHPPRPALMRGAAVLRAAMTARKWEAREVSERIRPQVSASAVSNWVAAQNAPTSIFRVSLGKLLGFDPDLLLPENETEQERLRREGVERGILTRRAKRTPHRRHRAVEATPEPAPLPAVPPAPVITGDQSSYHVDLTTGMGELRLVLARPHPELEPLLDLIRQELMSRRGFRP